ncbi:hypothetical protein [Candidatus Vampirococcus lugosii]|uniref:Uncharacterized protein n=1 Tax=Candidatus Vampirococcus lugosii TaxID=2789015 RepID=A0ABS5QLX3_9BACT|nr:hypothetical protein [Candidatus Vampirococcus lugosii]MBS8122188.1 hypothetical protein [Candidatus Vampirococcus lugosii]
MELKKIINNLKTLFNKKKDIEDNNQTNQNENIDKKQNLNNQTENYSNNIHTQNINNNKKNNSNELITNKQNNIQQSNQSQAQESNQIQTQQQNQQLQYQEKTVNYQELKNELNTIWDILKIKENTQADHIIRSIPSDRWINMDEIKQNIKLEFNIEYKNEKSLYPYLKTLTDINLIKVNNTGKRRTWKKNVIIIEK